MNLTSVSGKNWIFKEFNSSDVSKFLEDFSITEIVAKLLSIRKKKNRRHKSIFRSKNQKSFTKSFTYKGYEVCDRQNL